MADLHERGYQSVWPAAGCQIFYKGSDDRICGDEVRLRLAVR